MESKEEFETAVCVKNMSSKKAILDYGYRFLAGKGCGKTYRLKNTKTDVNFIVNNSTIAYELMKYLEEGKQTNKELKDIEVQLTMIPKGSDSETGYSTINNDKNKSNKKEYKMSAALKASIQKDEELRNIPYFQRHTKELGDKAGVISMDSPYENEIVMKRLEEKESRKKDISSTKFTSVLPKFPHNKSEGLDISPFGNIEGYKFRGEDKGKWINKKGFQIYG